MAIKAMFPNGVSSITVDSLHQWDYGQELEIECEGLLLTDVEVHFSCSGMAEAIVHNCFVDIGTGIVSVRIPDPCLEQSTNITAWVYDVSGAQGRTIKSITIPVVGRARPNRPSEIPPEVANCYEELIDNVNSAIDDLRNGDVTVKNAQNAVSATHANSADKATTATTAQSANTANTATTANTAEKATKDSQGNTIHTTYRRVSGVRTIIDPDNANIYWNNSDQKNFFDLVGLLDGKPHSSTIGIGATFEVCYGEGDNDYFAFSANGFWDNGNDSSPSLVLNESVYMAARPNYPDTGDGFFHYAFTGKLIVGAIVGHTNLGLVISDAGLFDAVSKTAMPITAIHLTGLNLYFA